MIVNPADIVSDIEELDLQDDELVESVVMIIKTSRSDRTSTVTWATTPGLSQWEAMGMTYDTLQTMTRDGDYE